MGQQRRFILNILGFGQFYGQKAASLALFHRGQNPGAASKTFSSPLGLLSDVENTQKQPI